MPQIDYGKRGILDPSVLRSVIELVGIISLPAAVMGVFGVFLGWIAESAYLGSFGIYSGWESTDVVRLIVLGWVEILFLLLMIAFVVLCQTTIDGMTSEWSRKKKIAAYVASFLALILSGVAVAAIFFTLEYSGNRRQYFARMAILGLFFAFWWLQATIGQTAFNQETGETDADINILGRLFRFIFSSRTIIVVLTFGVAMYCLMSAAVARGVFSALRDKSGDTRLPQVRIVTNEPMSISEEQSVYYSENGKYYFEYVNLRMVGRFDEHILVFRLSEVQQDSHAVQTYAVPLTNVMSLQLREWYWQEPTPTPTRTATPIPTDAPKPVETPLP